MNIEDLWSTYGTQGTLIHMTLGMVTVAGGILLAGLVLLLLFALSEM